MSDPFSGRRDALFLRARSDDATALVTSKGTLTVGQTLRAASAVAERIRETRRNGGRFAAAHRPCVLLPSSNTVSFLTGLLGCNLAGAMAVPWREDVLPLSLINETVRADAILRCGDSLSSVALEELDGLRFEGDRPGEIIMMTSGSTGTPKGVALDYGQLALNAASAGSALGVWRCASWAIDIDMALMSAVCHFAMAWQFDLPFVHLKGLAPSEVGPTLGRNFGFGGSPLQLVRLHEKLPAGLEPKLIASSGDFLRPDMIDAILDRHPQVEIHKLYGLTELSGRFCHMPHHDLMRNKAAAGRPLPGHHARIADPDREGRGEIEARTAMLTSGYYLPGGTFEPITSRWFATGDLGSIDENGIVTVFGRADDVFKVGGEKVDRLSIETALVDLLKNRQYCVLPIEHHLFGLCPALFVETSATQQPPTWVEVVTHLRERLPARYTPSLMFAVDGELPRLASGKLDRLALTSGRARTRRLS